MKSIAVTAIALVAILRGGDAFSTQSRAEAPIRSGGVAPLGVSASPAATEASAPSDAEANVSRLKSVLAREYTSFFDPMVDSWYDPAVSFVDPLTSLTGVDSYRNNVDMLAGRTLLGKLLFEGAGIALHSVTGGAVTENAGGGVDIADVVTRWTLRVTASVLPWKPEAVFSGISVYDLKAGGPEGVTIVGQKDYWDSINIQEGRDPSDPATQYAPVPKSLALNDFLGQLAPEGFLAPPAAPELPFVLLRRGDGYELRRYPGFAGATTTYNRRDFGFGSLGSFTKGMDALAPSIMKVYDDEDEESPRDKTMTWPLRYSMPGESGPPSPPEDAAEKAGSGQWKSISVDSRGESVVAVRTFDDAAMGPVVRNADRELRIMLRRDGLVPADGTEEFVVFAQYDAVHSMGKRRGEVWIELKDGGHPF